MSIGRTTRSMFSVPADQGYSHSCRREGLECWLHRGVKSDDRGRGQAGDGKLVEALTKISVTMADICKAQTVLAELLKDIHSEQREQRAAMVRLAAMIEG